MPSLALHSFSNLRAVLVLVALFGLTTICRPAYSNQAVSSASVGILPANHVYNHHDYLIPQYRNPASRQSTNMYQNGGIGNKQVNMQQQVVVPSHQAPLTPTTTITNGGQQQATATRSHLPAVNARVDDLLKQVQDLNRQLPGAKDNVNVNHHVSKVSIGNTKETNINNISNSVAPITSKSITSQDVGPKSSHIGNQNANYHQSPVTHMNGDGDYISAPYKVKTHPTEEQKELKARLLALASKATANSPSEPILRYNPRTGVLERVPIDPNANLYKDKLHQALEVLNPKKLPTDKLKRVLDDNSVAHSSPLNNPYQQVIINQVPEQVLIHKPEPEYVQDTSYEPTHEVVPQDEMVDETAPSVEQVPTREDVVDQVRFELDDRLNRISDLLYFRPEFMNQLLQINDPVELTPVESVFKRMVLCNSDEQFCLPNYPPAIEHTPEEIQEPVLEEEPNSEQSGSGYDEIMSDNIENELVDDAAATNSGDVATGMHPKERRGYFPRGPTERARDTRPSLVERRQSGHNAEQLANSPTSGGYKPTGGARNSPTLNGDVRGALRPVQRQPQGSQVPQVRQYPAGPIRVQPQQFQRQQQQQQQQQQPQPQQQRQFPMRETSSNRNGNHLLPITKSG